MPFTPIVLCRRCDGAEHVLHIRVVEQRGVHDTTPGQMVERCTTHLMAIYQDIVMRRSYGLKAQPTEHQQQHTDEAVERIRHILAMRDEAQHNVALIGVDTAAAALSAIHLNAVLAAIVDVHLVLHHLIAAEDDGGPHLPQEETVGFVNRTRHIFLHSQIERKTSHIACQSR